MTTVTGVCADHRRVSASDAFAYKNLSDPIQINEVPKHESHLCKTFENIPDSLKRIYCPSSPAADAVINTL